MPNNNYDLTKLENIITNLRDNPSVIYLNNFRDELNKFFTESKCLDVLYTKNTDKLFFGLYTIPAITSTDQFNSILLSDAPEIITQYNIEIDSTLFDKGLSDREVLSLIIYNIGHLVTDSVPVTLLRRTIDTYLLSNNNQIILKDSIQYRQILLFGIEDTLSKLTSAFFRDANEIADQFVSSYGYGEDLETALNKCFGISDGMVREVRDQKLMILDWCFRLYNDIDTKRIPAIHLLNKIKALTGSALQQKEMDVVLRALNRIDTLSEVACVQSKNSIEFLSESLKKKGSLFTQIKYNGLRNIEDDFYEFMVRARNAETEDEVMYALKQINVRLSILDDYIANEEMTDQDKERWSSLYYKYRDIRDVIAKKKVYNKKNYGLFFDYNQLDKIDQMD